MLDADILIVGSGPAGVSAAWPLVNAGLSVIMIDQGRRSGVVRDQAGGSLLVRRENDPDLWRQILGSDLGGLERHGDTTPKLRAPAFRHVRDGFEKAYGLMAKEIVATGSLARGGLSAMWGAGAYTLDADEFTDWPIRRADLEPSYRSVLQRIGVSGVADDIGPDDGGLPMLPPMDLHDSARHVYDRYLSKSLKLREEGFRLGRARNAVLSRPLGTREACAYDGTCLWGCSRDSIYSADQELIALERAGNFRYIDKAFASNVERSNDGFSVHCRDLDTPRAERTFRSQRVILAAGAIASTILALRHLRQADAVLRCHPAFAMAFLVPSKLGMASSRRFFALGQLCYQIDMDRKATNDRIFGVVFSVEGLLLSDLVRRMPLTTPSAMQAIRILAPTMLVANGYLSGSYAECSLSVGPDGPLLSGSSPSRYEHVANSARGRIARAFRSCGAWALPTGNMLARLGSDGHFASSLPMSHAANRNTVSTEGELRGAPGLYIVDGSILPTLPPKHPTLTIMANADRIGGQIAKQVLQSR